MASEEKKAGAPTPPHSLRLEERARLFVSGVEEVVSFHDEEVAVRTVKGLLLVRGSGLRVDKLEKTAGHFLVVFLRVFLLLLTFIITLDRLAMPVTSLVALLSMFALAVSLSVQNVMSNVVNGIVILVNKPFKAGDFIQAGSVSGTVKDESGFVCG